MIRNVAEEEKNLPAVCTARNCGQAAFFLTGNLRLPVAEGMEVDTIGIDGKDIDGEVLSRTTPPPACRHRQPPPPYLFALHVQGHGFNLCLVLEALLVEAVRHHPALPFLARTSRDSMAHSLTTMSYMS